MRGSAMSGAPTMQRDHPVGQTDECRHHRTKDHHQRVHGGHRVEEVRLDQLQAGLEQLGADDQRHAAADQEHGQREHQVQRTDVLVIGAAEPALEEAAGLVVMIVMTAVDIVGVIAVVSHGWVSPLNRKRRGRSGDQLLVTGLSGALGDRWGALCGHRRRRGRFGGLLFGQPGIELGARLGDHHNRHEAMIFAAQLSTLTPISAWLIDLGPGFVDETWDSILFPAQRRYPPRVDDVVGGDHEAHLGTGRNHQRAIDVEQIVIDRVRIDARTQLDAPHRPRASTNS